MDAMRETVLRSGTAQRASGEMRLQGLHRGIIQHVEPGGRVHFTIPRLTGTQVHGPYPAIPTTLEAGTRVLIGAIDGRVDDLIVLHIL